MYRRLLHLCCNVHATSRGQKRVGFRPTVLQIKSLEVDISGRYWYLAKTEFFPNFGYKIGEEDGKSAVESWRKIFQVYGPRVGKNIGIDYPFVAADGMRSSQKVISPGPNAALRRGNWEI